MTKRVLHKEEKTMDLQQRKQSIEEQFNELVKQGTAIEQEKLRLQGEFRILQSLIDEPEDVKEESKEPKSDKK